VGEPVLDGVSIYVSQANKIFCFFTDGSACWTSTSLSVGGTAGGSKVTTPLAQGNFIYVGFDSLAYVLKKSDGSIVDSLRVETGRSQDGLFLAPASFHNGKGAGIYESAAIFVDAVGQLYALEMEGDSAIIRFQVGILDPSKGAVLDAPTISANGNISVHNYFQVAIHNADLFSILRLLDFDGLVIFSPSLWDDDDEFYFIASQNGVSVNILRCNADGSEKYVTQIRDNFGSIDEFKNNVSGMALDSLKNVYFVMDNVLFTYDSNGVKKSSWPLPAGIFGSPTMLNTTLVVGAGSHLLEFATDPRLSRTWSRNSGSASGSRTGPNTDFIGLSFDTVGIGTNVSTGWNSDNTEYTLTGATAGFGSDNYVHASALVAGNFELRAKLNSISATGPAAKAGVMILIRREAWAVGISQTRPCWALLL